MKLGLVSSEMLHKAMDLLRAFAPNAAKKLIVEIRMELWSREEKTANETILAEIQNWPVTTPRIAGWQ